MSELVLLEDRATVRVLTLNRPDKRNALSIELLQALHGALGTAIEDQVVRSIAVTGAGPGFCAGLDLREVRALRSDPARTQAATDILYETLTRIYQSPKPVMAAVNGAAAAGGAGLMSVCDLVIAAETARIGYPEVRRGLVAAIVMTYLIRQVGERHAKFLLLTGELVSAPQAMEMGLVNEVVPGDQLTARVDHWGEIFASCPPEALVDTKRILNELQSLDPKESAEYVRAVHTRMRAAESAAGAISSFLGKKP